MGNSLESRFERYSDVMVEALGHSDRATPARWYLRGVMLPGQRKSVEPMAARVHPQDVRSAHQSMHHLVADSEWSDTALLAAVAREGVPKLRAAGRAPGCGMIDDAGWRKGVFVRPMAKAPGRRSRPPASPGFLAARYSWMRAMAMKRRCVTDCRQT